MPDTATQTETGKLRVCKQGNDGAHLVLFSLALAR